MPKPHLAVRRPVAAAGMRRWLCLGVLIFAALVALCCGIACLWYHAHVLDPEYILGPAGIVFLTSGLVQLRVAAIAWRAGRLSTWQSASTVFRFCRLLAVGTFFAYLAALTIGPAPYIGCGWLATVTVWYTLLLLPLAVSPSALAGWREWTEGRTSRRISRMATVVILLVIAAEAGLQSFKLVRQPEWLHGSADGSIAAGGLRTGSAAPLGAADLSRLGKAIPGSFRVAVVGDDAALCGAQRNGYLARLEQMLPGLKLAPLPVSNSGASADLNAALAAMRPDLALVMVSVCEDLTHEPNSASWFDWRQLELPKYFAIRDESPPAAMDSASPSRAQGDFESFLRILAPQLAACRTPIDETMRGHWNQTLAHLDRLLESCQRQQLPVALVLVPGEFQVNRGLGITLARRLGYTAEQFDVDLPQRRLTGFADHRQLPLLDLLPHLWLCRQSPYEPNATVWNEQGHAAAASAIGGWLESRYGSQLASAAQLSIAP